MYSFCVWNCKLTGLPTSDPLLLLVMFWLVKVSIVYRRFDMNVIEMFSPCIWQNFNCCLSCLLYPCSRSCMTCISLVDVLTCYCSICDPFTIKNSWIWSQTMALALLNSETMVSASVFDYLWCIYLRLILWCILKLQDIDRLVAFIRPVGILLTNFNCPKFQLYYGYAYNTLLS